METKEQTLPAEPLPSDTLNAVLEDFYQNGVTIVRNVLSREACERIVTRVDEIFAEPYFMQISQHSKRLSMITTARYSH